MEGFSLNKDAYEQSRNTQKESSDFTEDGITNPFASEPVQADTVKTQVGYLSVKDRTFQAIRSLDVNPQRSKKTGKIEEYAFEPIGKGGEHLVVEFPTHRVGDVQKRRGVVKKYNFLKTRPVLEAHFKGLEERKKAVEAMEDEILERREKLRELREYFGVPAVPSERFIINDVPVSRDLVNQVFPNILKDNQELPETLPAWSSVQRHIDLPKDKTVSLTGYYPEAPAVKSNIYTPWFKKAYDIGHGILVGQGMSGLSKDERRSAIIHFYPGLAKVNERIQSDPAFKEKLQETVRSLIRYLSEVGVALDLAGKNNVVLVQTEKGWQLKMPDPLPLYDWELKGVRDASEFLSRSEEIPDTVDMGG